jgi:hypothetical protein
MSNIFCPYCNIGLDYQQMKKMKCNSCLHKFEIIHVTPNNDLKKHTMDYRCHCKPEVKTEGLNFIIVHNSFDGREGVEWTNELLKLPINEQ